MNILCLDHFHPKGIEYLKKEGFDVDDYDNFDAANLPNNINTYDGLIIRSKTTLTKQTIERMTNLKIIGRAGVGLGNLDIEAATKNNIAIVNCPTANSISTAEYTMGMIVSMVRFIATSHLSMREGLWEKNKFIGMELYRKTLGIIGFGNVGQKVAKIAKNGFDMQVLTYDPYKEDTVIRASHIKSVTLNELLATSDIITIHTSVTHETKRFIDKDFFSKMKDGVCIVNCGRGDLIDSQDLLSALESGKVNLAALDVYDVEPPDLSQKLLRHDRVITTPHLAGATREAHERVGLDLAEKISLFLKTGFTPGIINR